MQKHLAPSELILTSQGRIYHLDLLPEEIADTVIMVGDPDRVALVSRYFDHVETRVQHRELITHTGTYKGKRFSVVSTGMGTPNQDIVVTELDALVNIDFAKREVKSSIRQLNLIRLGTAGCLRAEVPVGSFAVSKAAIGLDNLMHFYRYPISAYEHELQESIKQHLPPQIPTPYALAASELLVNTLTSGNAIPGVTFTCPGFYGPQDRILRAETVVSHLANYLMSWEFKGERALNFEMEASALFGMARALGHNASAICVLVANRATGEFVTDLSAAVDSLIRYTLDALAES